MVASQSAREPAALHIGQGSTMRGTCAVRVCVLCVLLGVAGLGTAQSPPVSVPKNYIKEGSTEYALLASYSSPDSNVLSFDKGIAAVQLFHGGVKARATSLILSHYAAVLTVPTFLLHHAATHPSIPHDVNT